MELIGKFVKDSKTGDIGKIIEMRCNYNYYLIRWVHMSEDSFHRDQSKKEVYFTQYTPENIKNSGRFEILTGQEAFIYVL